LKIKIKFQLWVVIFLWCVSDM